MTKKDRISKLTISSDAKIKDALKKIDEGGKGMLFVCGNKDRLLGSLTDGDIRRTILKTGTLEGRVISCFKSDPIFLDKDSYTKDEGRKLMLEQVIEAIPIIDNDKKIVDILFWADLFKETSRSRNDIDVPLVIMAGGMGDRLGPFTKILPKPLIPVGEKPIIDMIMDKFSQQGVRRFYITLNYKGEMIKAYLANSKKKYKIDYIWEKEFLGTAGSLKLLPKDLADTFIVSNCDIIVNTNYADLLRFHRESKNIVSVTGSIQHYKMPYGVIHFEKDGKIKKIQEKPEFDLTVNTGVYLFSKKALNFIPDNKHFDMTDLLQVLLDKKLNVGVYPVSEKSYIDIGQWEEYKKSIDKIQLFI